MYAPTRLLKDQLPSSPLLHLLVIIYDDRIWRRVTFATVLCARYKGHTTPSLIVTLRVLLSPG
jgi:hypothetical protein